MPHITHYLPELDDPERSFIAQVTATMSDAQVLQFATAYRQARKDPQTILLMAVIGVVVPGLHRFWLGQVGVGFLYLLTWGLLLIGTITDVVKHKELAFRYNRQIANRIANNLGLSGKGSFIGPELAAGRDRGLFAHERHPA
jgi:TM2 domain-containing membrane protein YozV